MRPGSPAHDFVITATSSSTNTMGNLLYAVAVVLVIVWLIGFVGFAAGGVIHVLLVIAIVAVLLNIIGGSRRNI